MEYRGAIKRLDPFAITKINDWALIQAMSHEELNGLFDGLFHELY